MRIGPRLLWIFAACLGCGGGETQEVMPASGSSSGSGESSSSGEGSSGEQTQSSATTDPGDGQCGNGEVEADEACDDMNTDALDGCLADCTAGPNGVTRTPGSGLEYQGAGGGVRFDDACPDGEIMIGVRGQWQAVIERIQVVCGRIQVSEDGDPWVVTIPETSALPERGTSTGMPFEATCAQGTAVVGFSGRADTKLDAIGLSCAPLSVGPIEGETTLTINFNNITEVDVVGSATGNDFGPLLCGPGEVVTSALIRTEDNVNGLGLGCSGLSLG